MIGPVRGYFQDRAILMLGWLVLVALFLGFEWIAGVLAINKWVVVVVGFSALGYLIYQSFKGTGGREEEEAFRKRICSKCGAFKVVRVTEDKIRLVCPECE